MSTYQARMELQGLEFIIGCDLEEFRRSFRSLQRGELGITEERIKWHLEHSENCGCRSVPPKLLNEIRKRKLT